MPLVEKSLETGMAGCKCKGKFGNRAESERHVPMQDSGVAVQRVRQAGQQDSQERKRRVREVREAGSPVKTT